MKNTFTIFCFKLYLSENFFWYMYLWSFTSFFFFFFCWLHAQFWWQRAWLEQADSSPASLRGDGGRVCSRALYIWLPSTATGKLLGNRKSGFPICQGWEVLECSSESIQAVIKLTIRCARAAFLSLQPQLSTKLLSSHKTHRSISQTIPGLCYPPNSAQPLHERCCSAQTKVVPRPCCFFVSMASAYAESMSWLCSVCSWGKAHEPARFMAIIQQGQEWHGQATVACLRAFPQISTFPKHKAW